MFSLPRPRARSLRPTPAKPTLEVLESRICPYNNSGNAWIHPQLITISFVPDGTILGISNGQYIRSNLFSTFDAKFNNNTAGWENVILKAAQTWAASANVNFELVPDDGSPTGSGLYQQGAPNFGDIRIGGFNFGFNWLASTVYPAPASNYSVAGDISFNTSQAFNIGSTYDLFTVAAHEFGHALGLGESTVTSAVMYNPYIGTHTHLGTDDINGIHAIYGARPADGSNNDFSTATDISSSIDPVLLTGVVNNLNITSTSAADFYTFTAPLLTTSNMAITVQSTGLSLFTPSITVIAADQQTVLGSNTFQLGSGAVEDGATLTVNVSGVTAGTQYYVVVQGVDSTVFSTGEYALTLNFGILPNPVAPSPDTATLNGYPLHAGGGQAQTINTVGSAGVVDSGLGHALFSRSPLPSVPSTAVVPATVPQLTPTPAVILAGAGSTAGDLYPEVPSDLTPPAPPGTDGQSHGIPVLPPSNEPADAVETSSTAPATNAWQAAAAAWQDALPASTPAVAEAISADWTQDGALATVSLIFAGSWLRWHAAHKNEEERRHDSLTPRTQAVS